MRNFLEMHISDAFDDLHEYFSRVILIKIAMLLQSLEELSSLAKAE
jgi:hypothetical protein